MNFKKFLNIKDCFDKDEESDEELLNLNKLGDKFCKLLLSLSICLLLTFFVSLCITGFVLILYFAII